MAILKQHSDFTINILETVFNRLQLLEERLIETAYSPVNVRLAYYLLSNADPASGELVNVTHEDIGNTIGAVRQTVTETLNLMRKQGIVMIKPKKIRIVDRQKLEALMMGK